MKSLKLKIGLLLSFIIIGVVLFINFYKPYDKEKELYKVLNGKNFTYYSYTKDNTKVIKDLNKYINSIYDDFEKNIGVDIDSKIDVMIYKTSSDLTSAIDFGAYKSLEPVGAANGVGIYIVEIQNGSDIKETFRHELIHKLTSARNVSTDNAAYEWLSEGIAYYNTYFDNNIYYRTNNALRVSGLTNNFPDLSKILKNSSSVTDEWGYQAYRAIVDFVISKYGNDKLLEIIDNVGVKNINEILNLSEEEFIEEWKNFMIENY